MLVSCTAEPKKCAREGCKNTVGMVPYRIFGAPDEYCSQACVSIVFEQGRKSTRTRKKKGGKSMEVPAEDFGDSGVVRHSCDVCGKPLGIHPDGTATVAWKGRYGEYCSNKCLSKGEREREF